MTFAIKPFCWNHINPLLRPDSKKLIILQKILSANIASGIIYITGKINMTNNENLINKVAPKNDPCGTLSWLTMRYTVKSFWEVIRNCRKNSFVVSNSSTVPRLLFDLGIEKNHSAQLCVYPCTVTSIDQFLRPLQITGY